MNSWEDISLPSDKLTVLCRLCLSVNDKLFHLFHADETDALAIPLSMKVSLCTAITVSKYDMLPQKICQNCLTYVNGWYMFRKNCKKVNSFLKKHIFSETSNENIEKETVIDENITKEIKTLVNLEETHQLKAKTKQVKKGESYCNSTSNVSKNYTLSDHKLIAHKATYGVTSKVPITRREKFECPICPDSFYFLKDLELHKSFVHDSKNSSNTIIRDSTDTNPYFKSDGVRKRTKYERKCCDKLFYSKLKFKRHFIEKHPGEKPFKCETCGKKDFISEETLRRHRVLHTGKYRCNICSKTFTCNAILVLHKKDKHENDKPFICDICGKCFVTELLMNYHKRFHTGEKKYVCDECGFAVVTSSSLVKHKRTHSKERPHVCHVCGKGFIVKGRLTEHLRMHSGERPYACQICKKAFTVEGKLKRHVQIHSGEKLFFCEYCGNTYSTRYGLSFHLKSHIKKCQ